MASSRTPRPGLDLNDLLRYVMEQRASDLHIKVGSPPFVRVDGHLQVTPYDIVKGADTERIAFAIMPKDRADEFMSHSEADFALGGAGLPPGAARDAVVRGPGAASGRAPVGRGAPRDDLGHGTHGLG